MAWKQRYEEFKPGDKIRLVRNDGDIEYNLDIGDEAQITLEKHWSNPDEWLVAQTIDYNDDGKQNTLGLRKNDERWEKI